jgi:crossover junction endodeoxyribonuclease RuvC
MKVYIGIDPGVTGAVAYIASGQLAGEVTVADTPTIMMTTAGKRRRQHDEHGMADILRSARSISGGDAIAYIEWAQPFAARDEEGRPRQGVVSMFSYGDGFGLWRGMLVGLAIPYVKVRPQEWKRWMLRGQGGRDKNVSRAVAQQLFPLCDFGRKKDAGRAEAALIAEYGRRMQS